MKDKVRVLKRLVLFSVLTFVAICQGYIKGNLNMPGILAGTFCGVVLAFILLRRSFGLAKRGIFVETMSKRDRNIMLGAVFVLPLVFVIVVKYYFPRVDLSIVINATGVMFFGFVFTTTGALGMYVLEHRYGQKYYSGKPK
jgi:hypothetical protein